MPDPITGVLVGGSLISSVTQSNAAKKEVKAQSRAAGTAIDEQRAARESFEQRTDPFRQVGLSAAGPLAELLGLAPPPSQQSLQQDSRLQEIESQLAEQFTPTAITFGGGGGRRPISRPAEGADLDRQQSKFDERQRTLTTERDQILAGQKVQPDQAGGLAQQLGPQQQIEEINPVLSFLRQEGFEDIQESAAARGRLGAGGTLEELTQFNTQLASTIVPQLQQQRFSQLFNVLGLGSNVAAGQGTAGIQTAGNIGNLLQSQGAAQAQGAIGQGQAITGGISDLAGILGAGQGGAFGGNPGFNFLNRQAQTGGSITNPNTISGGFV